MQDNSRTGSGGSDGPSRRDDGTYVVNYHETSDIELSVTVVHAVLEATTKDPTDVNLNAAVQPDALNRIFAPKHDGTPRKGGTLSFDLAGCRVTVDSDGEIRIDPEP